MTTKKILLSMVIFGFIANNALAIEREIDDIIENKDEAHINAIVGNLIRKHPQVLIFKQGFHNDPKPLFYMGNIQKTLEYSAKPFALLHYDCNISAILKHLHNQNCVSCEFFPFGEEAVIVNTKDGSTCQQAEELYRHHQLMLWPKNAPFSTNDMEQRQNLLNRYCLWRK